MNQHTLVKLSAATIAVAGLAFWINTGRSPAITSSGGIALVTGLKAELNDVQTVRVVAAGNQTLVTLNKAEKNWTVAERDNYPADIEKVREFLIKLADATVIEPKTSNPELYGKLGLQDVTATEAAGVRVEIDGLKAPAKLIIGNYSSQGGGGTFARRNDEAQSWLAKGTLTPEKQPEQWLAKNLADIPSTRIQRIELTKQGKKPLVASKQTAADANYQIENVPKGKELKSDFEGNALASALAGLRLEDVKKLQAAEPENSNEKLSARYTTFDGLVINAIARFQDDRHWVTFNAVLDPVSAEANILREQEQIRADYVTAKSAYDAGNPSPKSDAENTPEDKAENAEGETAPPLIPLAVADAAKDKLERMQKIQQEVADLNARFQGWEFLLPPYTFSNMNRSIEDLLKPENPES